MGVVIATDIIIAGVVRVCGPFLVQVTQISIIFFFNINNDVKKFNTINLNNQLALVFKLIFLE